MFIRNKIMDNMLRPVVTAIAVIILLSFAGCNKNKETKDTTPVISYKLRSSWPHDTQAFTEGLVIHEGNLYESTGQKGSWAGIIDIQTGKPDKKVILDDQYFGEGITILNNKVYQLTWTTKVGFIYDL